MGVYSLSVFFSLAWSLFSRLEIFHSMFSWISGLLLRYWDSVLIDTFLLLWQNTMAKGTLRKTEFILNYNSRELGVHHSKAEAWQQVTGMKARAGSQKVASSITSMKQRRGTGQNLYYFQWHASSGKATPPSLPKWAVSSELSVQIPELELNLVQTTAGCIEIRIGQVFKWPPLIYYISICILIRIKWFSSTTITKSKEMGNNTAVNIFS